MSNYRFERNNENFYRAVYPGIGAYDVPEIRRASFDEEARWIGFNYAKTEKHKDECALHFFVDDYQFDRVWTHPETYVSMLRPFKAVCAPDFSTYWDFPRALQIYNHYRKHWVAALWQECGFTVIPTISWSDEESYSWCFDGEPIGGCVAVSTVGTQADKESQRLFAQGYAEMMRRLEPEKVFIYGTNIPDCCTGNIVEIPAFQKRLRTL